MNFITRVLNWILLSSANPQEQSVTVRGALVFALGVAIKVAASACLLGFACVEIDQTLAGQIIDVAVNAVFLFLSLVGSIAFLAGLIRKLWRTVTGNLA